MELEQLTKNINKELIGARHLGVQWLKDVLNGIAGDTCDMYNSDIDDGADDDSEDEYVMYDAFTFEKIKVDVIVYYGNVTREIGCVEVREA